MDTLDIEQSDTCEQPLQQSDWDMFNLLYSNPDGDIQLPPASESGDGTFGSGADVTSQQSHAAQEQEHVGIVEQQLAHTMAELAQLRLREQQLQAKNHLLEKVALLHSKQKVSRASTLDPSCEEMFAPYHPSAAESNLTVSLWNQKHSVSIRDISQLTLAQFSSIWTEYMREIGGHLLHLRDEQKMCALALEGVKFLCCVCVVNPAALLAGMQGLIDKDLAEMQPIDAAYYQNCLKQADLSEQQVEDLLYLRRLYIHRKGALSLEREALVSKPYPSGSTLHPQQELDHVAELAAALKVVAMQDCKAYHLVSHAMCRGVLSAKQVGIWQLHLYPYIPSIEAAMNALAAERGAASKQDIASDIAANSMTKEWETFEKYVQYVVANDPHAYVPILDHSTRNGGASSIPGGAAGTIRKFSMY
ncbi:hypothetical protein WJX82_010456 [Trebouxia sp. C0006]